MSREWNDNYKADFRLFRLLPDHPNVTELSGNYHSEEIFSEVLSEDKLDGDIGPFRTVYFPIIFPNLDKSIKEFL